MTQKDQNQLIENILKTSKVVEEHYPLNQEARNRLEKEFFELCNLQRHYSSSRWNIVSFFMSVGFGISSYFLTKAIERRSLDLLFCSFTGSLIFLFAIVLFRMHKRLTYAIQENLEALAVILGYYSPLYLREKTNQRFRSEHVFWVVLFLYILILGILCWRAGSTFSTNL